MKTVLISAPYMMPYVDRFRPVFSHYDLKIIVADVNERLSEDEIMRYAGEFDGTISGDDHFTERVIKACLPRLKVISKWGTGIDSIDRAAAAGLGVQVKNTLNAFTLPVSDSVIGYILAFARKQPWMDRDIKNGFWRKIQGKSLSECTLGVIGVGNVGKAVIRRAKAFGMRLIGNDIIQIAPDFLLENYLEMTDLETLLRSADFVTLNCDLNPTSYHLINEYSLPFMKSSAVLVNTARGPIIDEPALINALQHGMIGGAALDVFENEPLPAGSPLRSMDNVMLASHNSNSSPQASERVHWNTIWNLLVGLEIPCDDLDDLRKRI